eukprot:gene10179-10339_t
MWRSALVLLLIVQLATASSTVHVSDGKSLVAAFTNSSVSSITLDNDVRLSSGDWPDGVYRLNRNLTIKSDPHGRHLDLLAPSPNGILYLHDLAKLQYSCAPLVPWNILAYPREATVPGVNDIVFPKTVLWDGDVYNDTIYYKDFSTRMTVGENVAYGGYVVHKRGSWKVDLGGAGMAAGSAGAAAAVSPDAYSGQLGSSNASASSFRIMVGPVGTAASVSTFDSRSSCETVNSGASNVQQQVGSAGEARHGPGHLSGMLGGLASPARVGRMVGAGSFGRVFQGRLRDEEVAIKVIHHNSRAAAQVSTEVELMMTFNHPNLGASDISPRSEQDQRQSTGSPPQTGSGNIGSSGSNTAKMMETWIITAFCNAGNLQDAAMAHNEGGLFAQDVPRLGVILNVLLGVARGMDWLHEQNVLHGDLKAANVLLSLVPGSSDHPQADGGAVDQSETQLLAQVADFGLSRVIMEGATHLSTFTVGTITHQPPELMRSGRLSKPADVFSFGVLMWEVITGEQPWKGRMMGEIMTMVMIEGARLEFPATVSKAYADLARRCWLEDPAARPSFGELVLELEELLQQAAALQESAAAAVHAQRAAPLPVELSAAAAGHVCGPGGEGSGLNEEEEEEEEEDLYKTMSSTGAAGGVSSRSAKASEVEDVWAGEEL